jgi:hypothetical protein
LSVVFRAARHTLGVLTTTSLAPDQTSTKGSSGGRAVLVKGSQFRAQLPVMAPATNPGNGAPDPVPIYSGSCSFMTVNAKAQAG